jgi:WD40 repeat protein
MSRIRALMIVFVLLTTCTIASAQLLNTPETTVMAWSPDGKMIAGGGYSTYPDGKIKPFLRIWDVETGVALDLHTHPAMEYGGIASLSWSPDSTKLVTGRAMKVDIWQIRSDGHFDGTLLHTIDTYGGFPMVEWSSNKNTILIAHFGEERVNIWDSASYQLISETIGLGIVLHASINPFNNHEIAVAGSRLLLVPTALDLPNTPLDGYVVGSFQNPRNLDWSPNGQALAVGYADGYVRIYNMLNHPDDLSTIQPRLTITSFLTTENLTFLGLAWSPDGTRLAGVVDRTVHVWDTATGDILATYTADDKLVGMSAISWSPFGDLTYGSVISDNSLPPIVRPPTIESDGSISNKPPTTYPWTITNYTAWSPDGKWIAQAGTTFTSYRSGYPRLYLYDSQGNLQLDLTSKFPNIGQASAIRWDATSTYLAIANSYNVLIYNPLTQATLTIPTPHIGKLAWQPNGNLLAGVSFEQGMTIWEVTDSADFTYRVVGELDRDVTSVAWFPSGDRIVVKEGDLGSGVRLWDVSTTTGIFGDMNTNRIDAQTMPFWGGEVFVRNQGREIIMSGVLYNQQHKQIPVVLKHDLATHKTITLEYLSTPSMFLAPEPSPDGQLFAIPNYTAIRIYHFDSGEEVASYPIEHSGASVQMAWSPDGSQLAYGGVNTPLNIVALPDDAQFSATTATLREVLSAPGCVRACWLGIEPGVTTVDQFKDILSNQGITWNLIPNYGTPTPDPVSGVYFWIFSPSIPFAHQHDEQYGTMAYENYVVDKLNLPLGVPISVVVEAYRQPTQILVQEEKYFMLTYPDKGLVFQVSLPFSSEITSSVWLVTNESLHWLFLDRADVLPLEACVEPVMICQLIPATPSP